MKSGVTKEKVLTITGPTASGKTELALLISEKIKVNRKNEIEIISADSRQIFRHIPISTAQPFVKDLKKIKHHFVSELEIDEEFSAGEFGKKGRKIIDEVFQRGNILLIVGGSGLYLNSLLYGLFSYENIDDENLFKQKKELIRKELYSKSERNGLDSLVSELKKVDPETISKMKEITERRVIRALEVYYLTGIPISIHQRRKIDINFTPVIIGITWDRKILYERINKRTEYMIEHGLIDEVKNLKQKGYHYRNYVSLNTVGIKEAFDYLDNKISYQKMLELIKQNTRRYAKRQLTWFKRDKNIKWFNVSDNISLKKAADLIYEYYIDYN